MHQDGKDLATAVEDLKLRRQSTEQAREEAAPVLRDLKPSLCVPDTEQALDPPRGSPSGRSPARPSGLLPDRLQLGFCEAVADVAVGQQVGGLSRVVFEFLA